MLVENGIPDGGRLGSPAAVELTAEQEDRGQVLVKEGERVNISVKLPDTLKAPVEKGEEVGKLVYSLDGTVIRREPVYAACEMDAIDYWWCLEQLWIGFMP